MTKRRTKRRAPRAPATPPPPTAADPAAAPAGVVAGLRPKHARFVQEYLVDLNATQAAIRGRIQRQDRRESGLANVNKC